MSNIHNWELIETNKTNGTAKLKCPVCSPTKKYKKDTSLMVWFNDGIAKCFNSGCDALFFKDNVEKTTIKENYKIPIQTWRNYTSLSDSFIIGLEKRKISQHTILELGITQEKFYQPALQKEVDNLVFNFFEGETIVNKNIEIKKSRLHNQQELNLFSTISIQS